MRSQLVAARAILAVLVMIEHRAELRLLGGGTVGSELAPRLGRGVARTADQRLSRREVGCVALDACVVARDLWVTARAEHVTRGARSLPDDLCVEADVQEARGRAPDLE